MERMPFGTRETWRSPGVGKELPQIRVAQKLENVPSVPRFDPGFRPVESAIRERIAELLKAGMNQAKIGKLLDKAPSTIAHHVLALGRKPKEYATPGRIGNDKKRKCVQCGKRKTAGAFPSERNASCSMCARLLETKREIYQAC